MQLSEARLKELQQVELDIFKSFVSVCETLGIRYYLIAGTLLGAVRHKGFIPWDDDIDVGIPREDYELFISKAQDLLPSHLFLQTYKTDRGYCQAFAKIRNTNTAFIEESVQNTPINHGIYIDIFPLDKCSVNVRYTLPFRLKERVYRLRGSCMAKGSKPPLMFRLIRLACAPLSLNPYKSMEKLDKHYQTMPSGDMLINFGGIYGKREIMPAEWYGDGALIEFEGMLVSVPCEYDKVLTSLYGDYMTPPPVEKRVTHHHTTVIDTKHSYKQYIK